MKITKEYIETIQKIKILQDQIEYNKDLIIMKMNEIKKAKSEIKELKKCQKQTQE